MGKIRVFLAKFMKNKATNDRNSVKIKIFLGPTGARGVLQSHNACLSPCWLMALSDLYNLDSWSHKYCVLFRNQGVWSFLAMLISCRIFPHVVLPDTETGPMMPWRWPGISGALVINQEQEQKSALHHHQQLLLWHHEEEPIRCCCIPTSPQYQSSEITDFGTIPSSLLSLLLLRITNFPFLPVSGTIHWSWYQEIRIWSFKEERLRWPNSSGDWFENNRIIEYINR